MCHDLVSSRIASDVVHRTWATDQYGDSKYHNPAVVVRQSDVRRWSLSKELEDMVLSSRGKTTRLYFIGGEPLLVKEVGDLLRRLVSNGVSKDISIAVVSNGTVRGLWLDLMSHFKSLELSISIDGYGPLYEYIRYPGKWSTLRENLSLFQRIPNASLGAAVTLQFYNALSICELFRFLDSMNIGFYAWPVHVPRYLSVEALPPSIRGVAVERLLTYADGDCRREHRDMVRGLAEHLRPRGDSFDARLLRDCMLFTNDLDVSRRQSLADVQPELLTLCNAAGYEWTSETLHASVSTKEPITSDVPAAPRPLINAECRR
jgi:MoaA/NifB/PqqE/SkfB family radical SAM enzyme